MELLPKDLVSNVLLRLPAKDLMGCKCVCKLWFHIITDPQFISNYYVFYNSQQEQLLLIRTPNHKFFAYDATEISIVSWNLTEPKKPVSSRVITHPYQYIENTVQSFKFPFGYWMDIMGPCNGIYFLRGNPNVIMNPSLSQFIALPESLESDFTASHTSQRTCIVYDNPRAHFPRFGFNPKTNDYKVLVLKELLLKETHQLVKGDLAVELYSLNSNSWRNLGANAIPFPFRVIDVDRVFPYVNNCCHWFGSVYKSNDDDDDETEIIVLTFDMVNELFRKIIVPTKTSHSFKRLHTRHLIPCSESTTIGMLDYCLVYQGTEGLFCFCFDVWMLKDYWDEGSWIKRYTVDPTPVIFTWFAGYYGSNQFLWKDTNQKLVLYGLDFEEHNRDLFVSGNHEVTRAVRYMESLVSLPRGMRF